MVNFKLKQSQFKKIKSEKSEHASITPALKLKDSLSFRFFERF